MKAVLWVGSAREDVGAFSPEARQRAGFELYQVQCGLDPSDWKPMPSVGPGVREIRVHTKLEHRLIYIATFSEGVYVLHAFEKKTQQTRKTDIALARSRLRDVQTLRQMRQRNDKRSG